VPKLVPALVAATVGAVGLYIPAIGLFGPLDVCLHTGAVASAAPSPTCGGDLRECLRLSAKTDIYGTRYVTAEDVARCVETFDACVHGGASRGGTANPPPSTSAGEGTRTALPKHFRITFDTTAMDCRTNNNAVTCTSTRQEDLPNGTGTYSETGELTGTVSGMTLTGTATRHGRSDGGEGCISTQERSGPADTTSAIHENHAN
jgi:hypothetical protein